MSKKPLKIQASSISRIMKCPGSCTLESKLPDRLRYFAYKDAAEYGTMCHAVGESALLHGGKCGHDIMVKVYQHPRAEEVYTIGHVYAAAVLARRPRGAKMFIEEKFRTTIHGVDCVAKSDAYFVTPKTIQKFDLKSGSFDYYDSARQQMEYAAKLWCYINDEKDGRKITTTTVQPAYYSEARRVVDSPAFSYSREAFSDFVAEIKGRQKEFYAGDHCKMCSSILTCKTVKTITEEFFEMSKKATKEDIAFKDFYLKKGAVVAFLDAVESYCKQEMEAGKVIPGLTMEEYSGRRRWKDAGEVAEKLAYLKDKIWEPRELKSPAQLEKIAGKENIAGLYDTPRLKRVAIQENNFQSFEN